ncbi:MAG: archease [Candidatus Polarisedimenticolia bacterium]
MQPATYVVFDHTADVGLEIQAPTLASLFETAALGLFDLITDVRGIGTGLERAVSVSAADREELLVRWLAELLYLHDGEGFVFSRFEIESITDTHLGARAWGEPFDPARHPVKTELKAVTYHQTSVRNGPGGGWVARVVLDV